ncbi:MAG TPA: magnesium/cobalt transporter CorA [Bacteroidales bacterium]|nr:magnesium/cobalt transporter CorA [Bacteroidales bacterium]
MIEIVSYNKVEAHHSQINERKNVSSIPVANADNIVWLNTPLSDVELINALGEHFGIHQLTVEDILNTTHLPKFEAFGDYYFLTIKYLIYTREEGTVIKHVSLILKDRYVLSFYQGDENPVLANVKNRILDGIGNLRNLKADHLFYRLIDFTVDEYLNISNVIREEIDELDEITFEGEEEEITSQILDIKREINNIRRIAMPLRENLGRLRTNPSGLLRKSTLTYFQDVTDHLDHLVSSLDNYREILKDMMDLHLSHLSHSMNEVMKTLTIVATIFIPLTFLAGIFGMNFKNMPVLDWKFGYPLFWVLSLLIALLMFMYMKRKKWF